MTAQWRPRGMIPDRRHPGEFVDYQPSWREVAPPGLPAFVPYRWRAPRSRIGVLTRARVRLAVEESGEDEDG